MLTFLYLEHADQIQKIILDYPVQNFRWIVSDLKSKQDLQKLCIEKNNYYSDENILRVSDFWAMWLRRLAPQFQVLSSDFMRTYLQQFCETDQKISIRENEVATLHYFIQQLAPLLLSSNHESLMEWFKENKNDNQDHKWYKWYLSAKYAIEKILEQNFLDSTWVSSYLQRLDLQKINESTPIVLDLGSEMTSVEMGIFNRIAQTCDVYVIVPNPAWKTRYQFLLNTYKMNEGFSQKKNITHQSLPTKLISKNFLRLSTQLAEIKWITQTVRQWVDQGIKPSEIALLSPQAEKYWPSLSVHFEIEGLPVEKPVVTSLISTGLFQKLIAELQAYSGSLTWEDLEVSYFQDTAQEATQDDVENSEISTDTSHLKPIEKIQFEKFKALFIELTDSEDLARDQKIKKIFYRKINLQDILDRHQFLGEILKVFLKQNLNQTEKNEFSNLLEIIFKDFLSKTLDLKFKFLDWLELFKSLLAKKEIKIKNSYTGGIQIRDLGAVYLNQITHRIWFGLDDSAFQSTSKNLIPIKDIEVLKNVFDFPLQYPEENHEEFSLRWLSESSCQEQYFSCSHVSLSGEPLNAALFILENNSSPDYLFHPKTRLDQLQNNFIAHEEQKIFLEKTQAASPHQVTQFKPTEISGTDLINYAQCEFKLLASRGFRLRDYSVVSIDLDPLQKGTLAHALFEYLIREELYKTVQENQISEFLDQKRNSSNLFPNEELFWSIEKNKFIQIGLKFSNNEKKRLKGQAYEHIIEKDFELKISDFVIKGRIDRIDRDVNSDEYLIYDYKRSDSQKISHIHQWISKKEYQMLFYLLALSEQLDESLDDSEKTNHSKKIRGAVYYFYQKLKINKGYISVGNDKFDTSLEIKKNMSMDESEFKNTMDQFKTALTDLFMKLKKSEFTANPDDQDICNSCDWRRLCRAHHLN